MSDTERLRAARRFFWEMMRRWGQTPTAEVTERQIHKLAEALPPFTRITKDPNNGE